MSMIPPELQGVFTDLADRLIPASDGMPAAGATLTAEDVDRVLQQLPGLLEPVLLSLRRVSDLPPAQRLERLRADDEHGLAAIGEAVAAAYFLVPVVAERIGYRSRSAVPVVFDQDLAGLTRPVVERGWRSAAQRR